MHLPGVSFHLGDGFSGVNALLRETPSGLLLIDPPYLEIGDEVRKAEDLFDRAAASGWYVLCWFMLDLPSAPSPRGGVHRFEICFREVDMECDNWRGACVLTTPLPSSVLIKVESHLKAFKSIMRTR